MSGKSFRVVMITIAWAGATAWAGELPPAKALPDFDIAGGLQIETAPRSALKADQRAKLAELEQSTGVAIEATFNSRNLSPRSLWSEKPLTGPSTRSAPSVAETFLRSNKELYGFTDQEIRGLRLNASYTDAHNGVTHMYYSQTVDGVPIFPASLSVHVNAKGQVLAVAGDVFPGLKAPVAAALTPERAAELGATDIGVNFRAQRIREDAKGVTLDRGALLSPVTVTRAVYALLGAPRPAYRMTLDKNGLEWYELLVDAQTGQILNRRNLYVCTGVLTPSSPVETNPATPRGLVYTEHPMSGARGTGDLLRKYPYTVDPAGRSRGFCNAPLNGADSYPLNPHGGDPLNAARSQTLLPLPDAASPIRSSVLPLSSSPQSPNGWFLLQGGHYQTIGNNVDAKDDHAGDNETTIGTRADGGFNGDFGGPAFEFQNYYGQNGPYADTAARLAGATPDLAAATLNLFYVCNWYHDFVYHLGFTEAAGNFQEDNFGRGGEGNDSVYADAQDGSGTDNANFGTPADGGHPRMQMFLWTGPERDGDLDFDVIAHEHTHGLSNRLVGGPADTSCLGVGLVGESGGMGEGWSDFYAAVISDDPAVGEYAYNVADNGIRRFSMDRGPDDFTYRFICTGPVSDPSLVPCEVHDVGEFWSIVLWEMREAMINRQHNRTYPGGPTFPTFTGTGTPAGNIHNAEGRTIDGSHTAAGLDRATIENASFRALFTVTDGMKLAPCNPTMVDMRNAILAADRAAGGQYQDLIWRTFANRGLGTSAASTGGQAPATVEDFTVPATVTDCESAGGPLDAPAFTAVSEAANSVTIHITANGAAQYVIYRGTQGAGTEIDPLPFAEISRGSDVTYTDTGLEGGFTYYYRVEAARNDDCVSASQVVGAVPLGGALPCAIAPSFAGVKRVLNPGDCQHVKLDWESATTNCVGGPKLSYNIYRGTTANFTPDAGHRIATGITGNSYIDTPGALDTVFYYIVRAEDSTTGHGGPANDGNEDTNIVVAASMVTSASLLPQGFEDDVESGPDNGRSAHFTSSGFTTSAIPERGGWFRDGNSSPAAPRSTPTLWHTFDPDNRSVSPSGDTVYELRSDVITITPTSILTFFHTFQMEPSFDGGVIEAAFVDGSGNVGAFQDLGDLLIEGPYTGVLDAEGSDNTLFGRRAYTGGTVGPMTRARAFLGALVPVGEPTQQVIVRFVFGSDVANQISVPPVVEGTHFPGWYIDDISIEETCCPISAAPENLTATTTGLNEITLCWNPPTGGGTISQYRVYREPVENIIPQVFANPIGSVPGGQTSFVDTQVVAGLQYAYVVRATPESGCPSADSNSATAVATGACSADPTFGGLRFVSAPAQGHCAIDLSWEAGASNCPGASIRYNVYRSTDSGFTPSAVNAVALGVNGQNYRDRENLGNGTTYYYIVRAEDTTTDGDGPANGGNEDANLTRHRGAAQGELNAGPDFSDDLEPSSNAGYTTFSTRTAGGWTVLPDATAHSVTHAWVAMDDQPGAPATTIKDDRLTLPPVNLTASSVMTFWHNFDFAQFPAIPTVRDASYESGGVLEISADGDTWFDLQAYITIGGYNGAIDDGAQNTLSGRAAWVGSSDGVPGTRADTMHPVEVNLGAAIQDSNFFGATSLPGARIRFRLGGTFQILIAGIQGSGWGVDDITITNVLTAGACQSCESCQPCLTCAGDLNGDTLINGGDIAPFIDCLTGACTRSGCADYNGDGVVDFGDLEVFVAALVGEANHLCP